MQSSNHLECFILLSWVAMHGKIYGRRSVQNGTNLFSGREEKVQINTLIRYIDQGEKARAEVHNGGVN